LLCSLHHFLVTLSLSDTNILHSTLYYKCIVILWRQLHVRTGLHQHAARTITVTCLLTTLLNKVMTLGNACSSHMYL
jgi:hypothetical protein